MILNALLIALREIRRNLTRSFLTVIGIVIGVAAVVTMVTLGRGATESVKEQISKMGSNLLILRPGQGWGSWGAPQFSMRTSRRSANRCRASRASRPSCNERPRVYQENDRNTDIQGTTSNYFDIANWEISLGRIFTEAEVEEAAPVCVIGETIRKELFGEGVDPIGSKIRARS
jgi:putative ABC transport system permease protein